MTLQLATVILARVLAAFVVPHPGFLKLFNAFTVSCKLNSFHSC